MEVWNTGADTKTSFPMTVTSCAEFVSAVDCTTMMKRIRHIADRVLFLRPAVWFVVAFWAGLYLQRWLYIQKQDGVEILDEMYMGIRPFSDLPVEALGVFILALAMLLTELVRFVGSRHSYWGTAGLVCGSGAAAFFSSWWLWVYLGEHCSPVLIHGLAGEWDEWGYAFVLSLVAGLILLQAWPRWRAPGKARNADALRTVYWVGILIAALAGLSALILAPPRNSAPITIAAFPAVLMILIVMAATALEALLPGRRDESSNILSLTPAFLAGAALPTVAVTMAIGLWFVASTARSLFKENLNARLAPDWNHPELLQSMTGRIYRVKAATTKGAELQFFDVPAGQWQSVPNAPASTEVLGTPGKWDVAGNLFAYVPRQQEQPSQASGKARSDRVSAERPRANDRKVYVASLRDGHRVASIDISTLPNETPAYIWRLRIAPDKRKIAILFKRKFPRRSSGLAKTPSRSVHAVAIYELPSGRFVRVLKDMEIFPTVLDWLSDSRHIVLALLERPKPQGSNPRRGKVRFWVASVDTTNSQTTVLAPARYLSAVVSPVAGSVFVRRSRSEFAVIPPVEREGPVRSLRTFPYPWFRLLGVSPNERLLLGSATIPVVGVPAEAADPFLLIVDAKSPETAHILDRNRTTRYYLAHWGELLWRPVKQ